MLAVFFRKFCSDSSKMVRVLNVAEKNAAAHSLADVMSGGHFNRREGLSKFNKIYEYEYMLFNQRCQMSMTSVSGHLLNYEFSPAYKSWHSCPPLELFDAPMAKRCQGDFDQIKKTLEREVRGCQTLIIWTDGDREGENIGFEIIQVCKAVKPNLRVLRARFSDISRNSVQRAIANLAEPDKNTNDAVDVRQELDLRIGAAFTRFQTLRLQKVFPDTLKEQLISYGSCQFPTLGFVVERYKEVEAFIPEPFWKIKVLHETEEGSVEFSWKRNRLFDYHACLALYSHVIENPQAAVVDARNKPKSKWRPAALDTVEMEKICSKKFRINAKEIMRIAEKLYTQGFISYPRTETNIFPKDMDLAGLIQTQTQDPDWGQFASGILQNGGPTPRNGVKSDQAHPPIHPIKYTKNLQGDEKKIYEYVVRHFLACCSQDAKGHETTVDIQINDELFSASGLMIIAKNYLEVYPYDVWRAKVIPVFNVGETFTPKSIDMNQGATSPPSLLTESDLIALMDKYGIGTDATHAEHIETIKARLYIGVTNEGKLLPGELGIGLVDGYDSMGFMMSKPYLRSELEADLVKICKGQKLKDVVLNEQIQKYKEVFIEATSKADQIDGALSQYFGAAQAYTGHQTTRGKTVKPCPKCGVVMTVKTKKDGKGLFISCNGYPNCNNALWLPAFVLEAEPTDQVCDQCQPGPVKLIRFKFKRDEVPPFLGETYTGCTGCDQSLKELFEIARFPSSNQGPAPSQRSQPHDSGYVPSLPSQTPRDQSLPTVVCSCGADARLLTVRKDGPNQGRQFYSCGKGQGGCTFFAWADESQGSVSGGTDHSGAGSGPSRVPGDSFSNPHDNTGSATVCRCGVDARSLTVRKEGPNQGRQFYSCGNGQGGCDFFAWADEHQTPTGGTNLGTGSIASRAPLGNRSDSHNNQNDNSGSGVVVCLCGVDAKSLTVRKEGPNQGRPFYSCVNGNDGCGFFAWADEDPTNNPGGTSGGRDGFASSSGIGFPESARNTSLGNSSDIASCSCGQNGKLLTVQKEGPNKGRQFYVCAKPRGEGCDFFQWADAPLGDQPGGGFQGKSSGGGRGKKTSQSLSGEVKKRKPPTCSACGVQGHTARSCKNKN